MTEEEARAWVADRFGAGAVDRLAAYAGLLAEENGRQNLVAPSTLPMVWSRHLVDSAQLAAFAPAKGLWLDIGSGGGLPGLVLALLLDRPFLLAEPRRLRAEFLTRAAAELGLAGRVEVAAERVEKLAIPAAVISARAVAGLESLLRAAGRCATPATTWILPRGQSGAAEIQASSMLRRAKFHVEQSLTDPAGTVLVASGIGGARA